MTVVDVDTGVDADVDVLPDGEDEHADMETATDKDRGKVKDTGKATDKGYTNITPPSPLYGSQDAGINGLGETSVR